MSTVVPAPATLPRFGFAPYRLSGQIYGALLNHRPQLAALGEAAHQPPYKAPPKAPVLAVMPRHTWSADGDPLAVPAGEPGLEIGVALGIVLGRVACRVSPAQALACVAGYLLLGEISLPLTSHYRPAVRLRARDGFCPVGRLVVPATAVAQPDALAARVRIDGRIAHETNTGDRLRDVAHLVADVSEFMTLQPGDVLSLGRSHGAPQATAGQQVVLEIDGLGTSRHLVVAEGEGA